MMWSAIKATCFAAWIQAVSAEVPFDVPTESWTTSKSLDTITMVHDRASLLRAPALTGPQAALQASHPGESMVMIKNTLTDALRAAALAEGVPVSALECARDVSRCPKEWSLLGTECLAPPEYTGPCNERIDFDGMTAVEKLSEAADCKVDFPCA